MCRVKAEAWPLDPQKKQEENFLITGMSSGEVELMGSFGASLMTGTRISMFVFATGWRSFALMILTSLFGTLGSASIGNFWHRLRRE